MRGLTLCLLLPLLVSAAPATTDAPVTSEAWGAFVRPKARWVLEDRVFVKEKSRIVVEAYDLRKVGGAAVARLRWTHDWGGHKTDASGDAWGLTQVAVTGAGIYFLSADMDDAVVAAKLKGKPSRSSPPKAYEPTYRNQGRFLHLEKARDDEEVVCLGEETPPGNRECDDICDGRMCISPRAGVVTLTGVMAPGGGIFAQKGYESLAPLGTE